MIAVAIASYGLAAGAFLVLTVLLALHYHDKRALRGLLGASVGTVIWAVSLASLALTPERLDLWIWSLDGAHSALWLAFLASLLPAGTSVARLSLRAVLVVGSAVAVAFLIAAPWLPFDLRLAPRLPMAILLVMSLAGLSMIEQVYRNSDLHQRRVLKPLCLAVGGLFVFDLFVYSHGLLLTQLDATLWASRGFVNALVVVPLAIGVKHHPELAPSLFVSRQTLFYSTTLVGSGLYLMAMAAAGYAVRIGGGEWGSVLQVTFLAASVLILGSILASSQVRARFKVFLAKHFYRYRYDYRDEWLRLIATLCDKNGGGASRRALKALADILQSSSGQLWVSRAPGERYESMAALGPPGPDAYPADHPLIQFLSETNWIVDTQQYMQDPERYSHALRGLPEGELPRASVIVPIRHEDRLLGLARLGRPPGVRVLNYEDHDLLKTVGRQMAVFVEQELTRERLAETRQFEAFNRTTAFLMHDLKNLIAQQALIVQNAPRFKHNPEFVDDAFGTIERSVMRMRKLLEQLQRRTSEPVRTRVSLTPVLEEVVAEASAHSPKPSLAIDGYCEVRGDRDKLAMIIAHAVRNAQDATPSDGYVALHAWHANGEVNIEISDTGTGMDEAFIRERLFRPFDTTKSAAGMGIGAYQIREYVRSLDGRVEVHSQLGQGTRLVLVIPGRAAHASPAGSPRRGRPGARERAGERMQCAEFAPKGTVAGSAARRTQKGQVMQEQLTYVLTELRSAWRFRWPALGAAWAVCLTGWAVVSSMPDVYEASARVYVDTTSQLRQILGEQIVEVNVDAQLAYVREAMLGTVQLERVARETGLALDAGTPAALDELLQRLRERITLSVSGEQSRRGPVVDHVYTLRYRDVDRAMALKVVQALLDTLVEDTLGNRRESSASARRFLEQQVDDYAQRLALAEQRLAEFKREHTDVLPGNSGGYFDRLQSETSALEDVRRELVLAESRRDRMLEQLGGSASAAPTEAGEPIPNSIEARIREHEVREEDLLLRYTDRHPDVVGVRETLERLREQRDAQRAALSSGSAPAATDPVYQALQIGINEVEVEIAALSVEVAGREQRVERLRSLIGEVPEVEAQLANLTRDYDVVRAQYQALLKSLETERLTREASETDQVDFNVIDPPSSLASPVAPPRPLLLLGVLFAGLAAGGAVAFLLSQLRPVFPNSRLLREVTGLPVLGTVSLTWTDRYAASRRMAMAGFGLGCLGLVAVFSAVFLVEVVGPGWRTLLA